jgi:hypothetical protein
MPKSPRLALALAATVAASGATATAQSYVVPKSPAAIGTVQNSQAKPSATYQGQWWTHPLGCEYSRAGRPGETVWYIIVNTARDGCPQHIVINGFSGIY